MSILTLRGVVTGFGVHQILHGVDLDVEDGMIAALLGLNGAGKSVTLKTISGLVPVWSGEVELAGDPISDLPPEKRVARGLAHVPQARSIFPHLSVDQNLRLGAYTVRDGDTIERNRERVFEIFPLLRERIGQAAGTLSGGEQMMLAVARAMMSDPRVVLVDEPSQGLAPVIVAQLGEVLQAANAAGTTILMVEQNVRFALELAQRVFLMQKGEIVYRGEGRDLDTDRIMTLLGVGELVQVGPSRNGGRAKKKLASRTKRAKPGESAKAKKKPGRSSSRGSKGTSGR